MSGTTSTGAGATAFVSFRTPSFARFRRMRKDVKSKSILRCLEYERLSTLSLSGRVLDFGGGNKTNYSHLIDGWGSKSGGVTYESANIDPVTQPTYLIAPDAELPCEDERYDTVISLNTFEHIYDVRGTLQRLVRVLRRDGELLFIVPFLFRVHGHPDDYTRGTPSFWRRILNESGFTDIEIEALTWGPMSTRLTLGGVIGPFKYLRTQLAMLLDVFYFRSKFGQDVVVKEKQDSPVCNTSTGYFIRCRRKG